MMMSLQELRKLWEKGLDVQIEIPVFVQNCLPTQLDSLVVILRDNKKLFYVNVYFPLHMQDGTISYNISADLQHGSAKDVFDTIKCRFPEGIKTNIL